MCCLIFNFSLTKCFAFARFHQNVTGHISSQQKKNVIKKPGKSETMCVYSRDPRSSSMRCLSTSISRLLRIAFRWFPFPLYTRGILTEISACLIPTPDDTHTHCNVYKLFMISRSQINRRPFTPRHYNNKDRMQHVTELGILILKTFWKILTPNININHRHLTLYIFYHDLKNMYPLYQIIHYVNLLRLRKRTF